MSKVTLDLNAFKALASDTRLNLLRTLDGKKMNLKDISNVTHLNKATLHEHLSKLYEAGLVKRKEREGHKWVYYKLTWKGSSLLHPENTKIAVLFCTTFITLFFCFIGLINFFRTKITIQSFDKISAPEPIRDAFNEGGGEAAAYGQNQLFLIITLGCLMLFTILMGISIWRFKKNKAPKL